MFDDDSFALVVAVAVSIDSMTSAAIDIQVASSA